MRGTFVNGMAKLHLEISGESWQQGEDITVNWQREGQLSDSSQQMVALALIDLRKMKKSDPKALSFQEEIDLSTDSSTEHTFKLGQNAAISDGVWTYSIVSGDPKEPLKLNRLDLTIKPWFVYEEIIKLIENFKRFKMKSLKNKKTKLDAKFAVPGGKEYGAIDSLNIHFEKIESSDLQWPEVSMEFHFKVKKLAYSGAAVETVKESIKVERSLKKSEYISFGDSINQDKLLGIFDEVFSEVSQRTRM